MVSQNVFRQWQLTIRSLAAMLNLLVPGKLGQLLPRTSVTLRLRVLGLGSRGDLHPCAEAAGVPALEA